MVSFSLAIISSVIYLIDSSARILFPTAPDEVEIFLLPDVELS
jgi:hypothetical protein